MSVLVTADLHLSENQRDRYRLDFMERVLPALIKEHKPRALVILGDLTENKDRHNSWLVNVMVKCLRLYAKACDVLILRGNHDGINPDEPFFEFVRHMPGITFITRPTETRDMREHWQERLGDTLFLPHTRDHEKDWDGVRMKGRRFIFAHNTFKGADNGFGRTLDGIPLTVFPRDAVVISGDVHVPQRIGAVTYVGAPYNVDFGDDYKARLLRIHGEGVKTVSLANIAQKRLVEVSSIKDLDARHLSAADIVKVKFSVKDYADWPNKRKEIERWAQEHGVNVHQIIPVVTHGDTVERTRTAPKTDEQILKAYAKQNAIDDRTLDIGLNLMDEK